MIHEYIDKLSELHRSAEPFVSVTMVDATGSTPQDRGAKMLVSRQGRVCGTVGGGRIEQQAIAHAQAMLNESPSGAESQLVRWNLQRDVGMTCGGVVTLFFDTFQSRTWRVVIFGAGHVAQALVRTLLPLDCRIACVDSRREWLDRLPRGATLAPHCVDSLPSFVDQLRPEDYVLCMTMGHRTDRPIMEEIFRRRLEFPYLGVIGSRAKRKVLVRELQEAGIEAEQAERFICPIGLPIGRNHPAEIALGVAAQLLAYRDRQAERAESAASAARSEQAER